jgi:chaperonin GroEL
MSCSARGEAELVRVAVMAADGDDAVGALLAQALLSVGWDGDVTIDADAGTETALDLIDGFRLPVSRITSDLFPAARAELRDARVLLHDGTLRVDESLPALIEQARGAGRPLVVVARAVADDVASRIAAATRTEGPSMLLARIDTPDEVLPEMLDDLSLFTGATVRIEAAGQGWPRELHSLGAARLVRVERSELRIVDGEGSREAVEARLGALRRRLDAAGAKPHSALYRRRGRLAARSAVVRLGAVTEPALRGRASLV